MRSGSCKEGSYVSTSGTFSRLLEVELSLYELNPVPAGTGFNSYSDNSTSSNLEKVPLVDTYEPSLHEPERKLSVESLILDDRVARNYSFNDSENLLMLPEDIIN